MGINGDHHLLLDGSDVSIKHTLIYDYVSFLALSALRTREEDVLASMSDDSDTRIGGSIAFGR